MSSVASPFGLKPAFHPSGIIRQSVGTILSGAAPDIFQFSPVGLLADGSIAPIASTAVATTGRILGAFMGVEWTGTDGRRRVGNRWESGTVGTEIVAYYTEDPGIIYEIQADGSIALADFGASHGWSALGGNTTTGLSNVALLSAGPTADTGLRVVGVNPAADNIIGDDFTIVQVMINKHQYTASGADV